MTTDGDDWFRDASQLLAEIREAEQDPATPVIAGLDNLELVARGGQGLVYRARRALAGETVAVKLLRDGALAVAADHLRFEREIELARELDHPGIVRVHENGTTSDGLPYLVMDWVEGRPLDAFLDGADRRSIIEVIRDVAEAVGHAHSRGVIHRDLKPGNILVADAVRVLDFGLARATGSTGESGLSITGQFLGSLPWASPEQAGGGVVDVRTDVYAMGVMLYRALVKRFPYEVDGPVAQVLDNIRHTAPAPPTTPTTDLDTDLQTILLKCLAKDVDRRYQSAGEVARELDRYLADEPIEARSDSTWYTLRKTLARHRVATGAGLVVAALTIASSVTLGVLWRWAVEAEALAETRLIETQAESAKVAAVNEFLLGAFGPAGAGAAAEDITVRDLLDKAASRVEEDLADQPEVRAEVHNALSYWFAGFRRWEGARHQQHTALVLRTATLGPDDERLLENHRSLAWLAEQLGDPEGAIEHGIERVRLLRLHHVDDAKRLGDAEVGLAMTMIENGRGADALAYARGGLSNRERSLDPNDWMLDGTRGVVGAALVASGRIDEGRRMMQHALEAITASQGDDHSMCAWLRPRLDDPGR